MDIKELRKQPHLSVSSINSYIECGLQYKFSKIEKQKPDFLSDNLVFGSCIHRILAEFNQEKMMGNILSSDELEEMFRKDWGRSAQNNDDIQYSKGKSYRILLNQGVKLIALRDWAKNRARPANTLEDKPKDQRKIRQIPKVS